MNTPLEPEASTAGIPGRRPTRAGIQAAHLAALLCACGLILGAGVSGCSFLRPARSTARYFVLTPMPAGGGAAAAADSIAVGVGQVRVPAYLLNTSLAVRKGTHEIDYLPSALWAERLDTGFQSVLAANLSMALPTDRIHLSAWRRAAVAAEVYVTLEQFDVDSDGRGVLVAHWRILSPGGGKILKAGACRLSRQGPPPDAGASGAVATLSELVAEFSGQLAQTLKATVPGNSAGAVTP